MATHDSGWKWWLAFSSCRTLTGCTDTSKPGALPEHGILLADGERIDRALGDTQLASSRHGTSLEAILRLSGEIVAGATAFPCPVQLRSAWPVVSVTSACFASWVCVGCVEHGQGARPVRRVWTVRGGCWKTRRKTTSARGAAPVEYHEPPCDVWARAGRASLARAATAIGYLGRSPSSVTRVITRRWPAKSSTA